MASHYRKPTITKENYHTINHEWEIDLNCMQEYKLWQINYSSRLGDPSSLLDARNFTSLRGGADPLMDVLDFEVS